MTSMLPSQCLACVWAELRPVPPESQTLAPVGCAAYPDQIPQDILQGADHRQARGDERGGVVFRQRDTPPAVTAFQDWEAFAGA